MRHMTFLKLILWSGMIGLVLMTIGCGGQSRQARTNQGYMDTPEFHVQRGDESLLNRQYDDARSSYNNALNLRPGYSPALSGVAAATAYSASRPGVSVNTRETVLKEARRQIERALENAQSDVEKARAHGFAIQVYVALKIPAGEWYEKASDHFEKAVALTPNEDAPYFYMARAEANRFNYEKANKLFNRVLSIGGPHEARANKELERLQKIQRALPGSRFGAKIANVDKITRADVAALFMAELRLDRLYKRRGKKGSGSFRAPASQRKFKRDPLRTFPKAVDIDGHPLERAIKEVIELGVKGLSPDPAHKFHPDQEFKRAEFAQLIQDVLIRITRDTSIPTRFIGQPSPFPDVHENVWYYNAARTVVSRGLMSINDKTTGAFEPMASVSGADALLTIRTMKEILKEYLR